MSEGSDAVSALVVQAMSGRYLARSEAGTVNAFARKGLKAEGIFTGDRVTVENDAITSVRPRRNLLVRPPVANVACLWVIVSPAKPAVPALFVDQVLVMAAQAGVRAAVVVNKMDLDPEAAQFFLKPYARAGFDCLTVSTKTRKGLQSLADACSSGIHVLAGPSGVGKSSIAQDLTGLDVRIGALDERRGRGRQTTAWCALLPCGEGWLCDSPGFSEPHLPLMPPQDLQQGYPEIERLSGECRFRNCLHDQPVGCAVHEALGAGEVDPERYARYRQLLLEVSRRWSKSPLRY